jgi:hypothetical protein
MRGSGYASADCIFYKLQEIGALMTEKLIDKIQIIALKVKLNELQRSVMEATMNYTIGEGPAGYRPPINCGTWIHSVPRKIQRNESACCQTFPASASLIVRQESVRKDPLLIDKTTRAIIEAVHFFKTRKPESKRILQKYLRLQNADELEEAYVVLAARFIDKPYPTIQSVKTILDWSRHPKAKTADPAQFIAPQFVEKLDKEGFIGAVLKNK